MCVQCRCRTFQRSVCGANEPAFAANEGSGRGEEFFVIGGRHPRGDVLRVTRHPKPNSSSMLSHCLDIVFFFSWMEAVICDSPITEALGYVFMRVCRMLIAKPVWFGRFTGIPIIIVAKSRCDYCDWVRTPTIRAVQRQASVEVSNSIRHLLAS